MGMYMVMVRRGRGDAVAPAVDVLGMAPAHA
jgi:hypothetical protein